MKFDIYLISKEGNNPRRALALTEIARVFQGDTVNVIDGVDASTTDFRERCYPVKEGRKEALLPGYVACSSAHVNALLTFLRSQSEIALVFEDDLKIKVDREAVESILSQLPIGFDWCKLNNSPLDGGAKWASKVDDGKIVRHVAQCSWSNVAYFVSRRGAQFLLTEMLPQYTTYDCITRMKASVRNCFNVAKPAVTPAGLPSFIIPTLSGVVEDRIMYLNLDYHVERRDRMLRVAQKYKLSMTRFPAIDGNLFALQEGKNMKELACAMGHKKMWETVKESGMPWLLLEDDVILSSGFSSFWNSRIAIPADLEVYFLGMSWPKMEECDNHYKPLSGTGCFAYILWPSGAEKLIASSDIYPDKPSDWHTSELLKSGKIKGLASKPFRALAQWSESSIAPRHSDATKRFGSYFEDSLDGHYGGTKEWINHI